MPFSFIMMNENDIYNADLVTNENFRRLAENVLPSCVMTKAAYDALAVKEADRLYVVIDGSKAELYIGELPISGGGSSRIGTQTALIQGLRGTGSVGRATYPHN